MLIYRGGRFLSVYPEGNFTLLYWKGRVLWTNWKASLLPMCREANEEFYGFIKKTAIITEGTRMKGKK